jgi:hypothetical protein
MQQQPLRQVNSQGTLGACTCGHLADTGTGQTNVSDAWTSGCGLTGDTSGTAATCMLAGHAIPDTAVTCYSTVFCLSLLHACVQLAAVVAQLATAVRQRDALEARVKELSNQLADSKAEVSLGPGGGQQSLMPVPAAGHRSQGDNNRARPMMHADTSHVMP